MVTVVERPKGWENSFRKAGEDVVQRYTERSDENALQKVVRELPENATPRQIIDAVTSTKTYHPESKRGVLENILGTENTRYVREIAKKKFEEDVRHAKKVEDIAEKKIQNKQETEELKQYYIASGMPEYESELMSNPKVTAATKQQIAKQHSELVSRGIRKPIENKENKEKEAMSDIIVDDLQDLKTPVEKIVKTEESEEKNIKQDLSELDKDVNQDLEENIKQKESLKKKESKWPKLPPPPETTYAEKEKWRAKNQTYNNTQIKEVEKKRAAQNNSMIRYDRIKKLNDSGKLLNGIGRLVINPSTNEPYAAASIAGLVNTETQDFTKTVNDFLIDAKGYFGGRVTNFDLQAFKSRLPTLINTDEGRRVIIEQMKLMEELQMVHDKELSDALRHYGRNASYSDISNVVEERTQKKEQSIIKKLDDLDKATEYMNIMLKKPEKYKDTQLWQDPKTGQFKAFFPKDAKTAESKGWVKW